MKVLGCSLGYRPGFDLPPYLEMFAKFIKLRFKEFGDWTTFAMVGFGCVVECFLPFVSVT